MLLLGPLVALGQLKIKGTIVDAASKAPMPGVVVFEKKDSAKMGGWVA